MPARRSARSSIAPARGGVYHPGPCHDGPPHPVERRPPPRHPGPGLPRARGRLDALRGRRRVRDDRRLVPRRRLPARRAPCSRSTTRRASSGYYDGLPDRVALPRAPRRATPSSSCASAPRWPRSSTARARASSRTRPRSTSSRRILEDAGVDEDVEWHLRQTYAPREFLCQYRETEMNFVHRLLEDEGIFYFFLHSRRRPQARLRRRSRRLRHARRRGAGGARAAAGRRAGGAAADRARARADAAADAGGPPRLRLREARRLPRGGAPGAGQLADPPLRVPRRLHRRRRGIAQGPRPHQRPARRRRRLPRQEPRGGPRARARRSTVEGVNEPFLNGDFVVTRARASKGEARRRGVRERVRRHPEGRALRGAAQRAHKPRIRGVQTAMVTGPASEPQVDPRRQVRAHQGALPLGSRRPSRTTPRAAGCASPSSASADR